MIHACVVMTPLSTEEVARAVGISRVTLERWLASRKFEAPGSLRVGKNIFRNWTSHAIERVRRYKEKNYRKGRGRKKRKK
jgi:predicted site-specific integrase-resolvase